jgi:hypothetical protein
MEYAYQLNEIRQFLNEDSIKKLDLIDQNQKLVKENYMLSESCENFIEVESNLHRKINKISEGYKELYTALLGLAEEFSKIDDMNNLKCYLPYLKALKVLDKYK